MSVQEVATVEVMLLMVTYVKTCTEYRKDTHQRLHRSCKRSSCTSGGAGRIVVLLSHVHIYTLTRTLIKKWILSVSIDSFGIFHEVASYLHVLSSS